MLLTFDHKKATQALNYFAQKEGGRINKMKALKLVYLADRYHLRKYGRPITNDAYFAMKLGPVPSGTKDIAELNDTFVSDEREINYARNYIESVRLEFRSLRPVDDTVFSDSDMEALDFAWVTFGPLSQFELAELTHEYPEWKRHREALDAVSRIRMDLKDFLDDPAGDVERCFELTNGDKQDRLDHLQELGEVVALWS